MKKIFIALAMIATPFGAVLGYAYLSDQYSINVSSPSWGSYTLGSTISVRWHLERPYPEEPCGNSCLVQDVSVYLVKGKHWRQLPVPGYQVTSTSPDGYLSWHLGSSDDTEWADLNYAPAPGRYRLAVCRANTTTCGISGNFYITK